MPSATGHRRRIAFFGGSFDPPHLGHLAVARAARDALRLDTVLFAPVGAQPLKPLGSTAPFEDRSAMTELAMAGEPGFALSRVDAPNAAGEPNYTAETLEHQRAEMPDAHLFCLMGADSFASLRHWRRASEIPFLASLVVASRPGQNLDRLAVSMPAGIDLSASESEASSAEPGIELRSYTLRDPNGRNAAFYLLPGLDVEISASEIRRLAAAKGPLETLVPAAVAQYIRAQSLYT
ncbi:MAG TPA: nicotinate (nicotinamide) nucleotide adenylyltransferase [Terracidiphilus sp.]|jgi:nicotinate-nucleotide adenylyltransferase